MTLATWFTPRRRRAETSRTASVVPPLTASEPVKVPEPRRSPEDATGPLRAPRGQHVTESGTPHPKRGAFNFARILAERACPEPTSDGGRPMIQTECTGCGLSVYDLPHEACDPEVVRDLFFELADDGSLYCQGCAVAGEGVFL